jgi:hypothetical protein
MQSAGRGAAAAVVVVVAVGQQRVHVAQGPVSFPGLPCKNIKQQRSFTATFESSSSPQTDINYTLAKRRRRRRQQQHWMMMRRRLHERGNLRKSLKIRGPSIWYRYSVKHNEIMALSKMKKKEVLVAVLLLKLIKTVICNFDSLLTSI